MNTTRDVRCLLRQARTVLFSDDDVNGQIVGGEYGMAWVTYDGRQQGRRCYPRNHADADEMCYSIVERIKKDCGDVFKHIYPEEKWMFHYSWIVE